jgi:hypothetical protein
VQIDECFPETGVKNASGQGFQLQQYNAGLRRPGEQQRVVRAPGEELAQPPGCKVEAPIQQLLPGLAGGAGQENRAGLLQGVNCQID